MVNDDLNRIREFYRRNFNIAVIAVALVLSFFLSFFLILTSFYLRIVGTKGNCCTLSQRHNTRAFGRTPLDEGTGHRRDMYLASHDTLQDTDLCAPDGIGTRNSSKRTTADPRLRLRGYRDRRL
jgi:hypothetical protein